MEFLKKSVCRYSDKSDSLETDIKNMIKDVKENGDKALLRYNIQFDGNDRETFLVSAEEIRSAYSKVDKELIEHMKEAAVNIAKFAQRQKESIQPVNDFETSSGVLLGHKILPLDSCCCYVPGGGYPLYSTALMLAIPARTAGVRRIAACSPAMKGTNSIAPVTRVAMDIAGVSEIYCLGGAHAVAAFAYGTEQVKPVDVIVGPGNRYVTEAKRQCYGQVGIDFLAGPSEVLIISEEDGNARYIAADLLAQSEHDYNAKGILVTTSLKLAEDVLKEVEQQLEELETKEVAGKSWKNNGEIILVSSLDEAFDVSNDYAPEHLEIHVKDEEYAMSMLHNYGSLFIGENAAEVFGDYISGTNHTLPTVRASRYTGGLYVGTFLKVCSYQRISKKGVDSIGRTAVELALGEGLHGHANAARVRLN